jgi:hypothetical protein
MKTPAIWPWTLLPLLLGVSGCGSKLVKVTGKLTYQGQPVPHTLVTFQPADGSRRSTGRTNEKGHFRLRHSRQEDGCTRGPHTVVLSYIASTEEEEGMVPPKLSAELQEVIAHYADVSQSPLHYEVKKNGEFFEIKLP